MEINRLKRLIDTKQKITNIGLSPLFAVIRDHNILSLFSENIGVMKLVTNMLYEINLNREDEEDADNIQNEPLVMRKIKLILS